MSAKQDQPNPFMLFLVLLAVLAASFLFYFRLLFETDLAVTSIDMPGVKMSPASVADTPPAPLLDLDKAAKGECSAGQAERQEQFGFRDSVDLIVKPTENIRAKGQTIPMRQLLDEIKISRGGVAEKDLTAASLSLEKKQARRRKQTDEILSGAKQRIAEIDKTLPTITPDKAASNALEAERQKLIQALGIMARRDEIEAARAQPAPKTDHESLQRRADQLQDRLETLLLPKSDLEAYGVYIVKEGDNIWNVHFRFLREYFQRHGIALSGTADEPVRKGVSSGVGKILKFSENMVAVYNLREHRLASDLDRLKPLGKIMIFNLARVFSLYKTLDLENINALRFDGDTLWIPAGI